MFENWSLPFPEIWKDGSMKQGLVRTQRNQCNVVKDFKHNFSNIVIQSEEGIP